MKISKFYISNNPSEGYTSITANMTEKQRYAYWAKIRRKENIIAIVVFSSVVIVSVFIIMLIGIFFDGIRVKINVAQAQETTMSATVQESEMRACIKSCGYNFN